MDSLYFGVFMYSISGIILLARYSSTIASHLFWSGIWGASALLAATLTWYVGGTTSAVAIPLAGAMIFGIIVTISMPRYTLFGVCYLMSNFALSLCVFIFAHELLKSRDWSTAWCVSGYLLMITMILMTVFDTAWGGIVDLPQFSMRFQKRHNALTIIATQTNKPAPKVSIHVPCYKEPPQLVIATLNAISNLQYENYEVIVIDNNTNDEKLWRPVEAHCNILGKQFRFFHVAPLLGAKAGAMNFALKNTDPDAKIIAAIDADYIAETDFLKALVPLFEDDQIAYVQASHDYRDWRNNPFLSSVYYYYIPIQKIVHPATNEYNAANLVGTMCLIRRKTLEEVGGWAEWSLTEDDELSVRLQGKGYIGHVFADTWGRGLIPDTYEGVKKQLFRWLAGPIQEFRVHWRIHLGLDNEYHFSAPQRILRIKRLLGSMMSGLFFIPSVLALLLGTYLTMHRLIVIVPDSVLIFFVACSIMTHVKIWITVKHLGGRNISDYIMTLMLGNALRWNAATAFFIPLFKLDMPWIRTDKFEQSRSFVRAFQSAKTETGLALLHFIIFLVFFYFSSFKPFDLVALISIWFFAQGLAFMCGLVIATISEIALKKENLITSPPTSLPLREGIAQHFGE